MAIGGITTEGAAAQVRPDSNVAGRQELYVSATGDDSHDGFSPARPLRTISRALSRARPGVTINVAPGGYYEQVVSVRGGAPGADITIRGAASGAVIDGSALHWRSASDQNKAVIELHHPFIRLEGLTVRHSKNTGILLDADDLTVENCIVADTQLHGISTDTARQADARGTTMIHRLALKGNTVERAALSGNGQAISVIADGFLVAGNIVRDSPKEGIDVWLGSRRGEVSGNRVYGNAAAGIYVDGAAYVKIEGNLIYRNRGGIGVSSENPNYDTHDIWVFNNLIYENSDAGSFIWDDKKRVGHAGVQRVLIAFNTLVNNKYSIYLAGQGNSSEIANNLGYALEENVHDRSQKSSLIARGNVWLRKITGFVSPRSEDFRLTIGSPAVESGSPVGPLIDESGSAFDINEDFAGRSRVAGTRPDAGAFEFHLGYHVNLGD